MKALQITTIFLSLIFLGGCGWHHYHQGIEAYDEMRYARAIPHLEKAVKRKGILDARKKLADAYRLTGNSAQAEKVYKDLVKSGQADITALDHVWIGRHG